jgi:hypothetical protein
MGNICVQYDCCVPRLACSDCGSCGSVMGKSLCGVGNRGCCHHFPEFTLADIHKMVHIAGGLKALKIILGNPGTKINSYNIHAKGYFDEEGYNKYVASGLLQTEPVRDHTIFFKVCPFVEPGSGCILPPRFRTAICNFFICREILEKPELQYEFKPYIEERSRYSRWIYRESAELQHLLAGNGVSLTTDFDRSLKLLADIPMNIYEFPELPPVYF